MGQKSLFFQRITQWSFVWLLLLSQLSLAQSKITGTVLDGESNTGLPGATVQVKGTTRGAATDIDGKFSLEAKSGDVLVVSSVGYVTKEVNLGNQSNLTIVLATDAQSLDEIVVTGYGAQAKKDITGAVATVDMKKALAVPATNLAQAIQGRVAGVNVSNENAPGGGVMVRVRGFGTINDNSPLYVIDGTPTKGN